MYQILARKWRPTNFAEVIGQTHVVRALTNSLEQERLHQAYLFAGTRGVGKTTLARIFARCLNCEKGVTAEPCGECGVCKQIGEGRFADLIEIDAASRTGVDDMRELLESAQYGPVQGRRKVYLIDEVHMLSLSSFNALLKTLEEPPEHIMFLFATTHPKKIPITVLSRCLQLNLTRLLHSEIADYMVGLLKAEGIAYEDDAVQEVAAAADGSMRDGLSLLDQAVAHGAGELKTESVREMLGIVGRNEVGNLFGCIADGDTERLLTLIGELYAQSADFIGMAKDMVMFLHAVAVAQASPKTEVDVQFDAEQVRAVAQKISPEDTQLFYQIAVGGLRDIPVLPNVRNAFEMMCLRMLSFKPLSADAGATGAKAAKPARATAAKQQAAEATTAKLAGPAIEERQVGRAQEHMPQPYAKNGAAKEPGRPGADSGVAEEPADENDAAGVPSNRDYATDAPGNRNDAAGAPGNRNYAAGAPSNRDNAAGTPANEDHAADAPADTKGATTPTNGNGAPPGTQLADYQDPDQWAAFIDSLHGIAKQLCRNSLLQVKSEDEATILLSEEYEFLIDTVSADNLSKEFSEYLGRPVRVTLQLSSGSLETPNQQETRRVNEARQEATQATENDPLIRELQEIFDARVIPESIQGHKQ